VISETVIRESPVGVPSASLDTCDQVGIFVPAITPEGQSILPWGWVASRPLPGFSHDDIKAQLSESLKSCGRVSDADAVARCGQDFKVGQCNNCLSTPAFPISCDNRLCPDCSSRRGSMMVSQHRDMLRQIRNPKMLTLTFLSVDRLDKTVFKEDRAMFTRLRDRRVFESCWGGIYSFETTYTKGVGWHVHIHALIGSGYIDQKLLSKEWEEISGAKIVDIRAVKGTDKWDAVKEVVKYPAKSATFLDNPALVNEFMDATQGVNLAYGFGALYRVKTRRHGDAKMACPVCGERDIDFLHGYGFHVSRDRVQKIRGGFVWRPGPPRAGPSMAGAGMPAGSCT